MDGRASLTSGNLPEDLGPRVVSGSAPPPAAPVAWSGDVHDPWSERAPEPKGTPSEAYIILLMIFLSVMMYTATECLDNEDHVVATGVHSPRGGSTGGRIGSGGFGFGK